MQNKWRTLFIRSIIVIVIIVGLVTLINLYRNSSAKLTEPRYKVFVASQDIQPGELFSSNLVGVEEISVRDITPYIQTKDLDIYNKNIFIHPIFKGEIITKSSISASANPAAESRISLALDDPAYAAIEISVKNKDVPQKIISGDYIDIIFLIPQNDKSTLTVTQKNLLLLWVTQEKNCDINCPIDSITIAIPRDEEENIARYIKTGSMIISVLHPFAPITP